MQLPAATVVDSPPQSSVYLSPVLSVGCIIFNLREYGKQLCSD